MKIDPSKVKITEMKPTYRSDLLITMVREQLTALIGQFVKALYKVFGYKNPDFSEDEEWEIDTGYLCDTPHIEREVRMPYCDVEDTATENWEVQAVLVALDGSVHIVAGENEEEIPVNEITTDELAGICRALEMTYIHEMTK